MENIIPTSQDQSNPTSQDLSFAGPVKPSDAGDFADASKLAADAEQKQKEAHEEERKKRLNRYLDQIKKLMKEASKTLGDRVVAGACYYRLLQHHGRTDLRQMLKQEFPDHKPRTLRLYGQHAYHYLLLQRKAAFVGLTPEQQKSTDAEAWFARKEVLQEEALEALSNGGDAAGKWLEGQKLHGAGQLLCAARLANPNYKHSGEPNPGKAKGAIAANKVKEANKVYEAFERLLASISPENKTACLAAASVLRRSLQEKLNPTTTAEASL
jgi:murein DD-endopeptidase MepM/ murein hydrolase activator NlpD